MGANLLKSLKSIIRHPINNLIFRNIYKRLNQLEYRQFNRRFYAIDQITEYLIGADVPGDYLEFGVYQGKTFNYAYHFMAPHFPQMRFFAFDSFQGLPEPKGIDAFDGYSSRFHEKEFACTESDFRANLESKGVDMRRVQIISGWFDETLNDSLLFQCKLKNISVVWIDCDLYESTVPVLNFITRLLSTGSVVVFDDWRCFRNHPGFGEQRACREWLTSNPSLNLHELISFGWNGIAFTVQVNDK